MQRDGDGYFVRYHVSSSLLWSACYVHILSSPPWPDYHYSNYSSSVFEWSV